MQTVDRDARRVVHEEALGAFVSSTRRLLDGASLDEALADIVRGAGMLAGADLVVARVAGGPGRDLVAHAVHAERQALAAELEGSRVEAEAIGTEERAFSAGNGDRPAPPALRRAASTAQADVVLLIPVVREGVPAASLELYRRRPAFSRDEQALARLAAGQLGVAVDVARAVAEGEVHAQGARLSLELAGDALAAGSDESEAADEIVRLAAEAVGASAAMLWRVEADGPPSFLAAHGLEQLPDLGVAGASVERALEERGERTEGARAADDAEEDGSVSILRLGEPPAGALQLFFHGVVPDGHADRLSAFAARAAVALRRTRRAQLVAAALERSQTIVAVVSQAIARLSLSHTLETAVERISELTASAHVAIYLREDARLTAAASRGLEGRHTELAERLLELALGPYRSRGFLFISDLRRDPRLAGLEPALAETGVRRALVVPLVVREEVIGALAVFKTRAHAYRAGEEGLLLALSSQLAVAVQNARLHERTKELGAVLERALESERKWARQLRGLFEISDSFARSLSLDATLDAVAKTMVELFELDAAVIRMPDERGRELETRAVYVRDEAIREAATVILARPQPLALPSARELLEAGRPVLVHAASASNAAVDLLLEPFLTHGSTAALLPLRTPGEVLGTLTLLSLDPARPLDDETVEAALAVAAQAALAIDNARLYQQEKDFAETMQRSLIPRDLPDVPGVEIGHVYESSARVDVGGDVYDFLVLEDGRLAVVLGDVSGKGINATADMAMAKYAFRALTRLYPEPSDFLARANEIVSEEVGTGKFITMAYVLVDPAAAHADCASGGHPPARLVQADGSVQEVSARGLALGIERGQRYEEERVALDPGATLVLHTDGVVEARRDGEVYGDERLDALLARSTSLSTQELAEAILADCRAFAGRELGDDCAIVCLRLAR